MNGLRQCLSAVRANNESQMVLNRFIAGSVVLVFNLWTFASSHWGAPAVYSAVLYLVLGLVACAHIVIYPAPSPWRRLMAMLLDIGAVSYELSIGGVVTSWLFPAYLWIVFGNGFRFGYRFLLLAMALSIVGFTTAAAVNPFWTQRPELIAGVAIGLIIVPLYALAFILTLSKARHQAEEASNAKSLFLANVSHELRTPLNAIIGMGALLQNSRLDLEQAEMAYTIKAAAGSLLTMINGILDLSRIEAGHMPVTDELFDLARLLGEIRTVVLSEARLKGIELSLHVTARTPLLLRGDSRWVREVLLNLIGNAIKFTDTGGVSVGIDGRLLDDSHVRMCFEVVDTGIGIAEEAQERIFDMFTQADEAIVRRYGGTGLGLALCRKVVRMLGGEIGVQSAPGKGSTFRIDLDLEYRTIHSTRSGRIRRHAGICSDRGRRVAGPTAGAAFAMGRARRAGGARYRRSWRNLPIRRCPLAPAHWASPKLILPAPPSLSNSFAPPTRWCSPKSYRRRSRACPPWRGVGSS